MADAPVYEVRCKKCGAEVDPARWSCQSCGAAISDDADYGPSKKPSPSSPAKEPTAHEETATKRCPDCAETVQASARVCRYCSYRFDRKVSGAVASAAEVAATSRKAEPRSMAGALVLTLVYPGIGHFYIREWWRGVVFFAAWFVSAGALAFALLTLDGSTGWAFGAMSIVLIAALLDVSVGAGVSKSGTPPRGLDAAPLIVLVLALLLQAGTVVEAVDEADDATKLQQVDPASRPGYERCLNSLLTEGECDKIYLDD